MSRRSSNVEPEEPMHKVQRSLLALVLLAPFMLWAPQALAQGWPQRTVKFLLPLGPGSGVDIGGNALRADLDTTSENRS